MPVISIRHVRHVRKTRECCVCFKRIHVGEEAISMFGMAEVGDKPYPVWLHPACAVSKEAKKHKETCEICKEGGEE